MPVSTVRKVMPVSMVGRVIRAVFIGGANTDHVATARGRVWEGGLPPFLYKVNGKLKRGPLQHYKKKTRSSRRTYFSLAQLGGTELDPQNH